eukprot:3493854-Rhodomonas_salina.2
MAGRGALCMRAGPRRASLPPPLHRERMSPPPHHDHDPPSSRRRLEKKERKQDKQKMRLACASPVSYTHLRAHETEADL